MGTQRDRQREATRERIVEAAVHAFAERGFRAASTRDIARRAGTNQGLITYHFRSKDELWRAAADRIFGILETRLLGRLAALEGGDAREWAREAVREYVRFAAAHLAREPERLDELIEGFRRVAFLRTYGDDDALARRLGEVTRRVGLPALPDDFAGLVAWARGLVRERADALLPPPSTELH